MDKTPEYAVRRFFRGICGSKSDLRMAINPSSRQNENYSKALERLTAMGKDFNVKFLEIKSKQAIMGLENKGFPDGTIVDVSVQVRMNGVVRDVRLRCLKERAAFKPDPVKGHWFVVPASMHLFPVEIDAKPVESV